MGLMFAVFAYVQINDIDPADQSTWPDGAHMYGRNQELHMKQFSPKAYQVICDFLGGEDKKQQLETNDLEALASIVRLHLPEVSVDDFRRARE